MQNLAGERPGTQVREGHSMGYCRINKNALLSINSVIFILLSVKKLRIVNLPARN